MEVLNPSIKEKLWHDMRRDLARYDKNVDSNNLLMCCACGRFLPQAQFTLEHLLPEQLLENDPSPVKRLLSTNERSGNILLCQSQLLLDGRKVHSLGCNSWKGKHYDRYMKEVVSGEVFSSQRKRLSVRHTIALSCLGYLAMVREFGYQVALTAAGVALRRQFFSPNRFLPEITDRFRMLMHADVKCSADQLNFWKSPFQFSIKDNACFVTIRNVVVTLPISRDPNVPIAAHLVYKPSKYILRPNFHSFFE